MQKDIYILGINRGHNASACLMKNDEIIFHCESERLTNIKYNEYPFAAIDLIKNYTDHIDYLGIAGFLKISPVDSWDRDDIYTAYIKHLNKTFKNKQFQIYDFHQMHHDLHAYCAFYNSGFKEAVCIIKDGMGSFYSFDNISKLGKVDGRENTSAYIASYPHNLNVIHKQIITSKIIESDPLFISDNISLTNSYSEGFAFEKTAEYFGFDSLDAGKVMGMSSYGNPKKYYDLINNNGNYNTKIFTKELDPELGYLFGYLSIDLDKNNFQECADFSAALQKFSEDRVIAYINNIVEKTNIKNICLSGGFFLNCVANYKILKSLDKDINIYVEPISSDAGTSIGAAKFIYHNITKNTKINKQKNIYYGPSKIFNIPKIKNKKCSAFDIAKLIAKKNIVALYQGKSESGPRALGNRSILYDPRDPHAKDFVNKVKKREWFRPFAGSIMAEHAHDWFDLDRLKDSPFMMYAVKVKENKKIFIPGILHVDETCRIQTVSKYDNKNYYNLINQFYDITEIPILFNTSFNLAGDVIVESIDDAIRTIQNSDISYLYLPEHDIVIYK